MIGYLLLSEKYYVAFVICKGFEAAFLSFPRNQIALKNEGVEFQCSTDLHNVSLRWYVNYAGSRDRMKIIVVVTILIVADRRPESTTSSSSIAPCSSRSSHSPPSSSPSILPRRPPIVFSVFPVPFFRPHIPGI